MGQTYTYSSKEMQVFVGGQMMVGVDEGDFIDIAPNADKSTKRVGAHGDVVFSISADQSGRATLRLLQTSPSNDVLQGFLNSRSTIPLQVIDLLGTTRFSATRCKVATQANIVGGMEAGTREWAIDFAQGKFHAGSNL